MLNRYRQIGLIVGGVALVASLIGLVIDSVQFMHAYLVAYMFAIGVPLGSLGLLMLQYVSGGAWGIVIRRILEAGTRLMPVAFLFFLPIAFSAHTLYEWTNPEIVHASASLTAKAPYLNLPFFYIRAAIYFAVWGWLAYKMNAFSRAQDEAGANAEAIANRAIRLSGPGMLLFVLTTTFASFDWMMSLDPEWYSTIYGLVVLVGQLIHAMGFVVIVLVLLMEFEPLASVLRSHLRDLGKLLFAFVMLWAYFAFSQFLIIWAGNLPDEIPWYLSRILGGWQVIGILVLAAHFGLPFLLLLSRELKSRKRSLMWVAALLVLMRLIDLYWNIEPAFHRRHLYFSWMDVVVPIALAGLSFAWFSHTLATRALLPVNDPEFEASMKPTDHFH